MKRKSPKDRLEHYFRSRFSDPKKVNKAEGWNVPSEELWDNIQKGLAKEKQPQRKFIYWPWVAAAASFLLLISTFQLFHYKQHIKALTQQLDENRKIVQKIQSDIKALNDKNSAAGSQPSSSSIPPDLSSIQEDRQTISYYNQNSPFTVLKEKTVFNNVNADENLFTSKVIHAASPNNNLGEASFSPNSTHLLKDNMLVSVNRESGISKTQSLIDTPPLRSGLKFLESPVENLTKPTIPIPKKKPKIYFSVDFSPVRTIVKSKGFQFGKHDFFPKKESQKTAYSAGFQVGIQWNRGWSLETGIRYNAISSNTNHNRKYSFKSKQEKFTNNGYYESNVSFQLGSSNGTFDTDMSLARALSVYVEEDTKINLDFEFSTKKSLLDIPIIIRKQWAIGPIGLNIKAGLFQRFLLSKRSELQTVNLNDDRLSPIITSFQERKNNSTTTNSSTHYLVGVGLAYKFHPSFSIFIDPTFTKSLHPVIGNKGASIFTQSKTVNVGFRYVL